MSKAAIIKTLTDAVKQAAKPVDFQVSGVMPKVDPGLTIEGIGAIQLPLSPAKAKQLIANCRVAPFGKGTKTLVDTSVRFEESAGREQASYAAFFADCEHEVERVQSGVRIGLAYNLTLKADPKGSKTTAAAQTKAKSKSDEDSAMMTTTTTTRMGVRLRT